MVRRDCTQCADLPSNTWCSNNQTLGKWDDKKQKDDADTVALHFIKGRSGNGSDDDTDDLRKWRQANLCTAVFQSVGQGFSDTNTIPAEVVIYAAKSTVTVQDFPRVATREKAHAHLAYVFKRQVALYKGKATRHVKRKKQRAASRVHTRAREKSDSINIRTDTRYHSIVSCRSVVIQRRLRMTLTRKGKIQLSMRSQAGVTQCRTTPSVGKQRQQSWVKS